MTTVKAIEAKLTQRRTSIDNTYLTPSKNMKVWYKDELLFVRKVKNSSVVVFRAMDGKIYSLNDDKLQDFKLL
tara:strand:+ start:703 stop:921 length:219 start_codon:yes stop_codon:yes gene_type:complete